MFNSIKIFLSNKDVQLVITAIVVGSTIQIMCQRHIRNHPAAFKDYVRNHPEILKEKEETLTLKYRNKNEVINIRGGEV